MLHIHPAFVYLPIALIFVSFLADLLGCLRRNGSWHAFGLWSLVGAATGIGVVIVSGYCDVPGSALTESQEHLNFHLRMGSALAVFIGALAVWRLLYTKPTFRVSFIYLAVVALAGALMLSQSWHSENVKDLARLKPPPNSNAQRAIKQNVDRREQADERLTSERQQETWWHFDENGRGYPAGVNGDANGSSKR